MQNVGWNGTSCSRAARATGAARSWPRSSPAPPPGVLGMTGGFPNVATFQTDVLGEIAAACAPTTLASRCSTGPARARRACATTCARAWRELQGRAPAEDELIVTSGGIECIDLVCRTLLDPGDGVVVEAPTYLGAIMAFPGYEASLTGDRRWTRTGCCVDVLAERFAGGSGRSSSTSSRSTRTRPGGRSRSSAGRRSSSSAGATAC